MQALVVLEPSRFEIREVPVPVPGPGEVLARVRAVSICGTDAPSGPRRLPGLLAAGVSVHPRPRVGRVTSRRSGRAPTATAGRSATGSPAPRMTRAASARSASRAATTCARTTASPACTSSMATASRALTRRMSYTGSRRSSIFRTALAMPRARSSTRPRSRCMSPIAAASARATRSRSPVPARSACWPAMHALVRGAARVIVLETSPARLAKAAARDSRRSTPAPPTRRVRSGSGPAALAQTSCSSAQACPATVQLALAMLRRGGRCAAVGIPTQGVEIADAAARPR